MQNSTQMGFQPDSEVEPAVPMGNLLIRENLEDPPLAPSPVNFIEPEPDPQRETAREVGNTWEFEGREYAKFVVNRTGNIAIPIMSPADRTKRVAVIAADFLWDSDEPFIEMLDLDVQDIRDNRGDKSVERRSANMVQQNAKLFRATVQRGWFTKFEDGELGPESPRTREQMLAYAPELQSDLVDLWLSKFQVERHFIDGTDDIESLLSEPQNIWFKCKIGDPDNPAHVLLVKFTTPSAEARRNYENDTFTPVSKQEGEKTVQTYYVNHKAKLRFARKWIASVDGAVLAKDGEIDVDTVDFRSISELDKTSLFNFRDWFNPVWMVQLADKLKDSFSLAGK
jgi:hypothetical protein